MAEMKITMLQIKTAPYNENALVFLSYQDKRNWLFSSSNQLFEGVGATVKVKLLLKSSLTHLFDHGLSSAEHKTINKNFH